MRGAGQRAEVRGQRSAGRGKIGCINACSAVRWIEASVAFLILLSGVWGDVVQTVDARIEGSVGFGEDCVEVGDRTVRWEEVLYVIRETPGRAISGANVIRFRNGEAWVADMLELSGTSLRARSPILGQLHAALSDIAALDFVLSPPSRKQRKAGSLYRDEGEPIPGKVLWIDAKSIAIDSPLGVIDVPRDSAVQYLFADRTGEARTLKDDEVALTDGTRLHGLATPNVGGLTLKHASLRDLTFPASVVRSVERHPGSVIYLAERRPHTVEARPLITQSVPPVVVSHQRSYAVADWLKGVRVLPKAALRYRLPDASGKTRIFRTGLQPVQGSCGDVHVRIAVGASTLHERQLAGSEPWPPLSLELPGGSELTIEVNFGKRIRFPCGIILCDPHVIALGR